MKSKLILVLFFLCITFAIPSIAAQPQEALISPPVKHAASPSFVPRKISDELMFSTVQIETDIGTGTSFVFNFEPEGIQNGHNLPCLVTNRHVIVDNGGKKANKARLIFHKKAIDKNEPLKGEFIVKEFNDFHALWIFHSNPKMDLCILPFLSLFSLNDRPFYKAIPKQFIPSDEGLNRLSAIEEILMVGYPRGLCDIVNNFPIFRRGITATHPAFDLNGEPKFLIDIAAFPGSSGSPVGIYNNGFYMDGTNTIGGNERFLFLGVMCAGPNISVTGEVTGAMVPSFLKVTSDTRVMMHLGYVIKSRILLELEKELIKGKHFQ